MSEAKSWKAAGQAIRGRRGDLRLTRKDLAARADVSVRYLADLETGARSTFRRESLSRVERALGWQIGYLDALAGVASDVEAATEEELVDTTEQQTINIRVLDLATRFRSELEDGRVPTKEWLHRFADQLFDLSARILPLVVKAASASVLSKTGGQQSDEFTEIIRLLASRYSRETNTIPAATGQKGLGKNDSARLEGDGRK